MREIGDLGLGPLSFGDVDDRHQLAGVAVVRDLAAESEDFDFFAVGANVPAASIGLIARAGHAGRTSLRVPQVGAANFVRRHVEEAIAGVAVVLRPRRRSPPGNARVSPSTIHIGIGLASNSSR